MNGLNCDRIRKQIMTIYFWGLKSIKDLKFFLKDQNLIQLFYGFLKEYHFYSALKPFLFHKKWKEKKKHIKKKFSPFYYISLLAFLFKRHVSRIELWTLFKGKRVVFIWTFWHPSFTYLMEIKSTYPKFYCWIKDSLF